MKALFLFIAALCILPFAAFAQTYQSKPGETVLKLEIEGRGNVYILLDKSKAPKTVDHIVNLAKSGFYNGIRFHRVEKTPKPYLVQAGDPQTKSGSLDDSQVGTGGSGTTVPFEDTGLSNIEGAVGLARNPDDKNSGDSQFYIIIGQSRFLDGKYSVFGKVVAGMDVVKDIQRGDRISTATIQTG